MTQNKEKTDKFKHIKIQNIGSLKQIIKKFIKIDC